MPVRSPKLLIPEPLRAQEPGTWAHSTVTVRLADIARRVLAENQLSLEGITRLERLIEELPHGLIRSLNEPSAPDRQDWEAYVIPYLGQSWLTVPWFFAETYFYRRILEATGYFHPGPGHKVDPFAYQKKVGLETSLESIRSLSSRVAALLSDIYPAREALHAMLYESLWGNRADLSLWPVDPEDPVGKFEIERAESALLANDAAKAAAYLTGQRKPVRVDIVCDNAGFELVGDLLLGYYLLADDIVQELVFQVKIHPTFVSDATGEDIRQTLTMLATDEHPGLRHQAMSLSAALQQGQIRLSEPPFWTSPLSGWQMPDFLWEDLTSSRLIVVKGDANYRRLLGDRNWPFTTPFADILSYSPAPLLALRTLKAEVASGLEAERIERLSTLDPHWMTNGKWGVIQFVIP